MNVKLSVKISDGRCLSNVGRRVVYLSFQLEMYNAPTIGIGVRINKNLYTINGIEYDPFTKTYNCLCKDMYTNIFDEMLETVIEDSWVITNES